PADRIAVEFHSDQQALAVDIAQNLRKALHQPAQLGEEVVSLSRGLARQIFLQRHLNRRDSRRTGNRIPSESRRVDDWIGNQDLPDLGSLDERGKWHDAAADRLADAKDVGLDVPVVHSPEPAGATHTGLDLVGHHESAEAGAEIPHPRQVIVRRNHTARLSLHWLDTERRDWRADLLRLGQLGFERLGVAIGHEAYVLQTAQERLPE